MLPLFANPAGFWALLGVPAILAIHFLQQRARVARTSTWFLIEKLAPDSARGRTWDRLRNSRLLWLQLAAVVVATWLLVAPRWVRAESAQTVVIVLDAAASLDAFRVPALAAARREVSAAAGLAAHTTWVVMSTHPRQPPLYRGPDRAAADLALDQWQPDLGEHDPGPALRLARGLAGATGRTLFVTDRRSRVPSGQRAVGVGRPLANVGFVGITVESTEAGTRWRALVKNHATEPQTRTWHWAAGAMRSAEQTITLAAGALTEISAILAPEQSAATLVLSGDEFAADDRLPFVRPLPKPLPISVAGDDAAAEFFRKLARDIPGVTLGPDGGPDRLQLARLDAEAVRRETRGGIFWPPADQRAQAPLMAEPVTAERDPLVAGLNWQGWFGTGAYGFVPAPGDQPLLWQGRTQLAFLRPAPAGGRQLLLAFDWATSNAPRLPATVLLVRRFLEAERDARRAPYAANFDAGAPVALVGTPADGAYSLEFVPATGGPAARRDIPAAERAEWRAPGRVGFFTVRRGDEVLVRGATHFADARPADFRTAETFAAAEPAEQAAAIERHTQPDPWATLWLLVLAGLVVAGWGRWSGGGAVA